MLEPQCPEQAEECDAWMTNSWQYAEGVALYKNVQKNPWTGKQWCECWLSHDIFIRMDCSKTSVSDQKTARDRSKYQTEQPKWEENTAGLSSENLFKCLENVQINPHDKQIRISEQVLPGLLASPSRTCSSVHSARECSKHSCKKRAWVRLTLFSSESRATVCSHSFHPLNQLANTPTWSRNIMVCEEGWRCTERGGQGRGGNSERYLPSFTKKGKLRWYVAITNNNNKCSTSFLAGTVGRQALLAW